MREASGRSAGSRTGASRTPAVLFLVIAAALMLSASLPFADAQSDEASEHDYHNNELTFFVISFAMTFGVAAILAGLFTMKFGTRRSRFVAVPMMLSGIAIWGIWVFFKFIIKASYPDDTIFGIIYWSTAPIIKPLLAVLGTFLGAGLALFIFLTVIVRS